MRSITCPLDAAHPVLKPRHTLRGRVVFLVWTPRGDDVAHLISCRYADRTQVEDYFSAL